MVVLALRVTVFSSLADPEHAAIASAPCMGAPRVRGLLPRRWWSFAREGASRFRPLALRSHDGFHSRVSFGGRSDPHWRFTNYLGSCWRKLGDTWFVRPSHRKGEEWNPRPVPRAPQ